MLQTWEALDACGLKEMICQFYCCSSSYNKMTAATHKLCPDWGPLSLRDVFEGQSHDMINNWSHFGFFLPFLCNEGSDEWICRDPTHPRAHSGNSGADRAWGLRLAYLIKVADTAGDVVWNFRVKQNPPRISIWSLSANRWQSLQVQAI